MSSQTTSPGAGASGGSSNTHTSTSPRISRYYPPNFQPQHYSSQPLIGINPHSVIASTIPVTTSLPTAAINEVIIANGTINGALPVTLGMGPPGSKVPKSATTVGVANVTNVLASPPMGVTSVSGILSAAGGVLTSAAVSPSSTISGGVSGSGSNASSIITGLPGLPYGIIMDPSDVNEVVGGGAEVVLGRDSVITAESADLCSGGVNGGGINGGVNGGGVSSAVVSDRGFHGIDNFSSAGGASGVNGEGAEEVEKEDGETDENPTEAWEISRSSSVSTIVPVSQGLTDIGGSLPSDSRLSLPLEEDMHEEPPKPQLGAWKDLRLVYAIVRTFTLARMGLNILTPKLRIIYRSIVLLP